MSPFARRFASHITAYALLLFGFATAILATKANAIHIDEPTYITYSRWIKSWWDESVRQEIQQPHILALEIAPVTL